MNTEDDIKEIMESLDSLQECVAQMKKEVRGQMDITRSIRESLWKGQDQLMELQLGISRLKGMLDWEEEND